MPSPVIRDWLKRVLVPYPAAADLAREVGDAVDRFATLQVRTEAYSEYERRAERGARRRNERGENQHERSEIRLFSSEARRHSPERAEGRARLYERQRASVSPVSSSDSENTRRRRRGRSKGVSSEAVEGRPTKRPATASDARVRRRARENKTNDKFLARRSAKTLRGLCRHGSVKRLRLEGAVQGGLSNLFAKGILIFATRI